MGYITQKAEYHAHFMWQCNEILLKRESCQKIIRFMAVQQEYTRCSRCLFYGSVLFFPNWNSKDKIIAYAILGGVPYYLSQSDPKMNLKENSSSSILKKGSILYSEPEFIMKQEFAAENNISLIDGDDLFYIQFSGYMLIHRYQAVSLSGLSRMGLVQKKTLLYA